VTKLLDKPEHPKSNLRDPTTPPILLAACFSLPRHHSVCFPDGAAFIAGSFQAFIGDFHPKLFKRSRRRLVGVPFGVIRCPRHLTALPEASLVGDLSGRAAPDW
jgi:hypothetical protein